MTKIGMMMQSLPLLLFLAGLTVDSVALDEFYQSSHADDHLLRGGHGETASRNLLTCPSLKTDEFTCSPLSSVWTEFDPLGDTPVSTEDGKLVIDVPSGGTPKNMWKGSENTAPRVYQNLVNNEDFIAEAKFGSLPDPGETYNDHGIFVRVNDATFLRFSSFSASNNLYLFISYICSGSAKTYYYSSTGGKVYDRMRVVKAGDVFTLSAGDASGFDTIKAVNPKTNNGGCAAPSTYTGVGLFAGNGNNNNNDFKATFEYFRVYCSDGTTEASSVTCGPPNDPPVDPPTDPPTTDPPATDPPTGPSSAGFSDTFTTATPLTDTWTVIDPNDEDCVVKKDGASLIYNVPSGESHDLWCNQNWAPRVIQPINDPTSLGIQAKFESITCEHNQMQGLIVMKSVNEFLRFGTHNKNGVKKLFFAKIASGCTVYKYVDAAAGTPGILRLERSGDSWTAKYKPMSSSSSDPFVTVHTQVVSNFQANFIGTYAGNHDPNPAFVASVDYFMVDTDPVEDSDSPITDLPCAESDLETLEVWSGLEMTYGGAGRGQDWLNVLGMVPIGTTSLTYSITSDCSNAPFAVTNPGTCGVRITSDEKRLYQAREFNVEIFVGDLCIGKNYVELVVAGTFPQTVEVTIDYQPSPLALPFQVDWDETKPLHEFGQMVDGHWGVEAGTNSIRTLNVGYDKIFTIGDKDWVANYEVLTSMTRHTSGNSLGIGMGWRGHYGRCTTPTCSCYPIGSQLQWKWPLETITWVRSGNSLEVWTYKENSSGNPLNSPVSGGTQSLAGLAGMGGDSQMILGQSYNMRSRIERIYVSGNPYNRVRTKVWKEGQTEPDWQVDVQFPINSIMTQGKGSVFLLSYNTDASWGPVYITPI